MPSGTSTLPRERSRDHWRHRTLPENFEPVRTTLARHHIPRWLPDCQITRLGTSLDLDPCKAPEPNTAPYGTVEIVYPLSASQARVSQVSDSNAGSPC